MAERRLLSDEGNDSAAVAAEGPRPPSQLHCVLDARPAMREGTGVGTYVEGLLRGYASLAADNQRSRLTVFTASWKDRPRDRLLDLVGQAGGTAVHRKVPVRILNWSWHHLLWPSVENLLPGSPKDDRRLICHSPHPLLLPTRKGRSVVTVHDLHFLERPEQTFGEVRRDYPRHLERSLRDAHAVICVSAHTRTHLLERFLPILGDDLEQRTFVVPNGIDLDFFRPHPEAESRSEDGPYLAVGRIEPRKNPIRILEAFAAAATEARLVWAGAPADTTWQSQIQEAIDRLGLQERVQVLGYVDREHLRDLYRSARALLYPSLHEGFGLPILEAMACGCPVLTGDRTAMPEVAGQAAVLVDPTSVDAIVDGIESLEESTRRDRLRVAGFDRAANFSWATCAKKTIEVYGQA